MIDFRTFLGQWSLYHCLELLVRSPYPWKSKKTCQLKRLKEITSTKNSNPYTSSRGRHFVGARWACSLGNQVLPTSAKKRKRAKLPGQVLCTDHMMKNSECHWLTKGRRVTTRNPRVKLNAPKVTTATKRFHCTCKEKRGDCCSRFGFQVPSKWIFPPLWSIDGAVLAAFQ